LRLFFVCFRQRIISLYPLIRLNPSAFSTWIAQCFAFFALHRTKGSQKQRQKMACVCQRKWSAGAAWPGTLEHMNDLLIASPSGELTSPETEPLAVDVVYEDTLTGARAAQLLRDLGHVPTDEEPRQCTCPEHQCYCEEIERRAETVTSVLAGILDYNPGVPRWGINE